MCYRAVRERQGQQGHLRPWVSRDPQDGRATRSGPWCKEAKGAVAHVGDMGRCLEGLDFKLGSMSGSGKIGDILLLATNGSSY